MKRVFILMVMFILFCGTTAFAKNDDYEEIKLKANGEEIVFEIEKQRCEGNVKHEADPEIIMNFPENLMRKLMKNYIFV